MKAYINVALYWSRNQLRRSEILQDPHFQLPKLEANMKSASFINFDPKNGNNFEKWRIQEFLFGVGGGGLTKFGPAKRQKKRGPWGG